MDVAKILMVTVILVTSLAYNLYYCRFCNLLVTDRRVKPIPGHRVTVIIMPPDDIKLCIVFPYTHDSPKLIFT
jgi:predicted RNA-binding protein with PUA domain